ncbi:MAG: hypothetical protein ABI742_03860 [Gemmatimonadota bacterium]
MTTNDPFDSRPDPVLGARLRECLDAGDHAAFVARVRARLPRTGSQWETLATWARPGIAAALILAASLGYWVVLQETRTASVGQATEVASSDRPTDSDGLLAVVLGGAR